MAMNLSTKRLLTGVIQEAPVATGFTSMFQAPRENYYNGQKLTLDFWGESAELAPVIRKIDDASTKFSIDAFINKEFEAPVMSEEFTLSTARLLERQMGDDNFKNPEFLANMAKQFKLHMLTGVNRQRRTVELMCSQVLQTGKIAVMGENKKPLYNIDFKQKASHLQPFTTAWSDSAGAKPFDDLEGAADVITTDSGLSPDIVIMSQQAYNAMLNSDQYLKMADNRRVDIIKNGQRKQIASMIYKGSLDLTSYNLDIYVYNGEYTDFDGKAKRYMDSGSVIVMNSSARLDLTFGGIPQIVPTDPRLRFLSARAYGQSAKIDFVTNAWASQDGKNISGFVASRPLPILTEKNKVACFDCGV